MNDTLKAAGRIGAELGAAKAENEKLREALRPFAEFEAVRSKQGGCTPKRGTVWAVSCSGNDAEITVENLQAAVSALSNPASSSTTEAYTALDMASQSAQAFRDGMEAAKAEPAPAQDERENWNVALLQVAVVLEALRSADSAARLANMNAGKVLGEAYAKLKDLRAAHRATRPAQIEQHPSTTQQILDLILEQCRYWHGRDEARRGGFACLYAQAKEIADNAAATAQPEHRPVAMVDANDDGMWADILPDVTVKVGQMLYAAPIAQTAPQGKFRMGDLVKKSSGSEWQGRICGTYSTALTPEGYAVESEAHAGSVQIYPAKALERHDS